MSDSVKTAGNLPEDVIPVWDHVWGTVAELHRFWKFHVDLCGNEQHVSLLEEILLGPLVLIRKAVLSHITMGIGRLLDRANYGKRANLSFAHLLETIQPYVTPEFAKRMANMRVAAASHCQPLLLWRTTLRNTQPPSLGIGFVKSTLTWAPPVISTFRLCSTVLLPCCQRARTV
jgi:hypothetical protein